MKRIFIKAELCNGCKNCGVACMQAHRPGGGGAVYDLDLADPVNESRNRILLNGERQYIPLFCRHCDSPECVASCISGALVKDEATGHVGYDADKCAACFMCVMNCPNGVLKPDRATGVTVIRCDFCERAGGEPSCVKSCPQKAIYVEEVRR